MKTVTTTYTYYCIEHAINQKYLSESMLSDAGCTDYTATLLVGDYQYHVFIAVSL